MLQFYNLYKMDNKLLIAAKHGDLENLKDLIDKGANINCSNDEGFTPLITSSNQGHLDIVNELLKYDVNINAKTIGWSALTFAAQCAHLKIVRALLNKNAFINITDHQKTTPLMHACYYGHLEIIKELLDRGANINLKNIKNKTAYDLSSAGNGIISNRIKIINEFIIRDLVSCNYCHKKYSELNQNLEACAKCITIIYCSKECQRNDWEEHKKVCDEF